jgi:hypothetical protein
MFDFEKFKRDFKAGFAQGWYCCPSRGGCWYPPRNREALGAAFQNVAELADNTSGLCEVLQTLCRECKILQNHIERQSTITQAIWNILKERHGYTDAHLIAQILADTKDEKTKNGAPVCPRCRIPLANGQVPPECLYCGASVSDQLTKDD